MASKLKKIGDFIGNLPDDVKIHLSKKPITKLSGNVSQKSGFKPKGLWYDCDKDWITWMSGEMPDWGRDVNYIYLVKIPKSKIMKLKNFKELLKFTERFKDGERIDWGEVSKHANGIEICPYQHSGRMHFETMWYYGWDVASGCIWNPAGMKINLVGVWNDEKNDVLPYNSGDITARVASKFMGVHYA